MLPLRRGVWLLCSWSCLLWFLVCIRTAFAETLPVPEPIGTDWVREAAAAAPSQKGGVCAYRSSGECDVAELPRLKVKVYLPREQDWDIKFSSSDLAFYDTIIRIKPKNPRLELVFLHTPGRLDNCDGDLRQIARAWNGQIVAGAPSFIPGDWHPARVVSTATDGLQITAGCKADPFGSLIASIRYDGIPSPVDADSIRGILASVADGLQTYTSTKLELPETSLNLELGPEFAFVTLRVAKLGAEVRHTLLNGGQGDAVVASVEGNLNTVLVIKHDERSCDVVLPLLAKDAPLVQTQPPVPASWHSQMARIQNSLHACRNLNKGSLLVTLPERDESWIRELMLAAEAAAISKYGDSANSHLQKLAAEHSRLQDSSAYEEALKIAEETLRYSEQTTGLGSVTTIAALSRVAGTYNRMGKYTEAEATYRRAQQIADELPSSPAKEQVQATIWDNFALLYVSRGRYGDAAPLQRRALANFEKLEGQNGMDVGVACNNLAITVFWQGNYAASEALDLRALSIARSAGDRLREAFVLDNLGILYRVEGRFSESEKELQDALDLYVQLRLTSVDVTFAKMDLAELYLQQDEAAKAEPLILDVVADYKTRLGSAHYYTGHSPEARHR